MTYNFDFSKITLKEYRRLMDPERSDEEGDEIIGRVAGLEPAQIEEMPFDEWRGFMRLFWAEARNAGQEKNSASESMNT